MRNSLALAFSLTLLAAAAQAATTAAAPAAKPAAAPAAKPAATAPAAAKPAPAPTESASGDVTAFDATKHVLTIKVDGKDLTVQLGKGTHLTHADGKAAAAADLKAGAKVTVTYVKHGADLVAKSVKIG